MSPEFSKSQIDRLGERLRQDQHLESDLELLDAFRSSFGEAQETVRRTLFELGLNPSGRIAKTTTSIVAKLKRSGLKLTRIQDIAGCRVVVENIAEQDHVVALVIGAFQSHKSVDRREKPSHGYRAVHVVVQEDGKSVEIQIRTELQHLWASISEEAASTIDQSIKYGGGPAGFHERLEEMSRVVAEAESAGQGRLSLDERRTIAASVADTMGLLMPDLDARRLVREILERTR